MVFSRKLSVRDPAARCPQGAQPSTRSAGLQSAPHTGTRGGAPPCPREARRTQVLWEAFTFLDEQLEATRDILGHLKRHQAPWCEKLNRGPECRCFLP